jgi:N-acyl-D-amino-acid deacylase
MKNIMVAFALLCLIPQAQVDTTIKDAIHKGLQRIQQGASNYPEKRQCFSCHHQALPVFVLTSAQKRGLDIEPARIKDMVQFSLKSFRKHNLLIQGQGVGGANTTVGYALATLASTNYTPDETTAALVRFLLVRQRNDGAWTPTTNRPPTEGSLFTSTALALAGLKKYGSREILDVAHFQPQIDKACERGLDWLLKNEPKTTEDKVFRLRGLVHGEAVREEIARARDLLLDEQKDNGSWAQLPDMPGDAYATATVLTTLRLAGLPSDDEAYENGVKYLLKTQKDDGSWLVETRSRPIQTFFDNGDPGGKSQFISFVATSWAVQALLETLPEKK